MPAAKAAWVSYFSRQRKDANAMYHLESIVDLVKRARAGEDVFPANVDVVTGGFPCQDFSIAGKRNGFHSHRSHDGGLLDVDAPSIESRGQLYMWMRDVISITQPTMFIAENVKGLTNLADVKEIIEHDFADAAAGGYLVIPARVLNAANYGVPQARERVIIFGFRHDLGVDSFEFPAPTGEHVTMRDALKNLPPAKPEEICDAPYSSRYMSRNRKRDWDDVSHTIPAMAKQVTLWPGSPDMKKVDKDLWAFGTGGVTRRLSWREAAAIQTFPASLEFQGNLISKYKQIGNAVPVKLAEEIAKHLRCILETKV